jgi:Zn-dependent peptidase ImmA (M78 family)
VQDIISLLELQLGVRVFVRKLHEKISGLFAYDPAMGACLLLNANHRRDRRVNTAVHELGHLVSRQPAEVLGEESVPETREERYAHAFARNFLMPARAIMAQFKELTAGATNLSRRHVIELAHAFSVSRKALVWRLEELRLVPVGAWVWFDKNGGITDEQEREVLGDRALGDPHREDAQGPTTVRLGLLAAAAWKQGLLSEGRREQRR